MNLHSVIRRLRLPRRHRPVGARDVCLSSFPKSGNTWVRFLLANVYNEHLKLFAQIDFHNIHDLIPEVPGRPRCELGHLPTVLKTHLPHGPDLHKAILIVRHPLDVMYSYFRYLQGEQKLATSLMDVAEHPRWGIEALIRHTNSYVKHCESLLIVTYERLHADPSGELFRILDFIDVSASEQIVRKAVARSSFDSMRAIEIEKGRPYGSNDFLFTRKGRIGEGAAQLSTRDIAFVNKRLQRSPLLSLLYGGMKR